MMIRKSFAHALGLVLAGAVVLSSGACNVAQSLTETCSQFPDSVATLSLGGEAQAFVQAGASVVITGRDEPQLENAAAELRSSARQGQTVLWRRADVSDEIAMKAVVEQAIRDMGGLHVLVNNAGVYGPFGTIEAVDWQKWIDAIVINLFGSVIPIRAVLPHFKERRYGKIIQLSGGGATNPLPRISGYAASKAAVVRLAEMPQFIGLKDATGDVTRPARLRPLVGPDFRLLSGDDATALAFFAQGGNGAISVTSNVAPGLCRSMFLACKQGQVARAQRLANPIAQLTSALFAETSPVPLKYALGLFDLMSPRVRLPLVELTDRSRAAVAAVIAQLCDEYAQDMIGKVGGRAPGHRRAAAG